MTNRLKYLSSKVGKRKARDIIRRSKSNSFKQIQKTLKQIANEKLATEQETEADKYKNNKGEEIPLILNKQDKDLYE